MTTELGGGSLLLAWQLKDKHVVIVGGGNVASGRIESVLVADAFVTIIATSDSLHPLTKHVDRNKPRLARLPSVESPAGAGEESVFLSLAAPAHPFTRASCRCRLQLIAAWRR